MSRQRRDWASREDRVRHSNWFILIDSKVKPASASEDLYVRRAMDGLVAEITRALPRLIQFNNTKRRVHSWNNEHINNVQLRYVIEEGNKNHTIHAHIVLRVNHNSNISLPYSELRRLADLYLFRELGRKPFVARPRLISADRVEEYMTKGNEFDDGVDWVDITASDQPVVGIIDEPEDVPAVEEPTEVIRLDAEEEELEQMDNVEDVMKDVGDFIIFGNEDDRNPLNLGLF